MPLNHVALTVADRERSAAFYAEHFGLTERVHDDPHLLILAGADGGLLALSEGEAAAAGLPRTNHFGIQLDDPDAVRSARARFAAAGVEETEWQEDGWMVRVQVLDPDGYRGRVLRLRARVAFSAAGRGRSAASNGRIENGWAPSPAALLSGDVGSLRSPCQTQLSPRHAR
jgi:catechol 2,3-dioxygenase-like lactoylglutathione lyase family enzyme